MAKFSVFAFAALLCLASASTHIESVSDTFVAKPNGQTTTKSISLARPSGADVTCTFVFATVGGTNEQWTITLDATEKGYQCAIERPDQPSYLYFMHFSAAFENTAKIISAQAYDKDAVLSGDQVIVAGHSIKNGPKFKNALSRVVLQQ
eukprot:m.228118 g.228118  ORF g.228118 m.228118 type:complete len:149 (+) comp17401_c0_seq1:12-458(+)